jgi:hypothetical protein
MANRKSPEEIYEDFMSFVKQQEELENSGELIRIPEREEEPEDDDLPPHYRERLRDRHALRGDIIGTGYSPEEREAARQRDEAERQARIARWSARE